MQHPTIVVFLTNMAIVVLCGLIIYYLGNPLALMGLLYLQPVPIIQEQIEDDYSQEVEGEQSSGDYSTEQIGFNAKIG